MERGGRRGEERHRERGSDGERRRGEERRQGEERRPERLVLEVLLQGTIRNQKFWACVLENPACSMGSPDPGAFSENHET